MDVLSDVLGVIRLSGAVFFTAEFSTPWALESPNPDLLASVVIPQAESLSLFHILVDGDCIVECAMHQPVSLESGDVIVLPHGQPHTMRSRDGRRARRADHVFSRTSRDGLAQVSFGGGGSKARFICGYLNWDQRFAPLLAALPTVLLVRRRDHYRSVEAIDRGGRRPTAAPRESGDWLATTVRFTMNEAQAARPGNAAMLGRLTELMFVEIIRDYMQQLDDAACGWLAGLRDPQVGDALRLLHDAPMRDWTVEALAREVALSRSALAQRFTRLIGASPMKYLSDWRMQLAKHMLRTGGGNVQSVAALVG